MEGASRSSVLSFRGSVAEELHGRCEPSAELGSKGNLPASVDDNHSSVSVDDVTKKGGMNAVHPCGILSNNCLPWLVPTVPHADKRRALSPGPPSMRKKAALRLSFKWKNMEGQSTPRLCECDTFAPSNFIM